MGHGGTHQCTMRRAQDDVRAAASGSTHGGGGGNEDHVAQLDYLNKAVVKETLRLHAQVPQLVLRELLADAEILGSRRTCSRWSTPGPSAETSRRGSAPRSSPIHDVWA